MTDHVNSLSSTPTATSDSLETALQTMPNKSKTFFLTGSSRGLGRSLAEAILKANHRLIATARRPKQLDDLAEQFGERILPLELDVADFSAAQAAVHKGMERFGGIDVVINNAGRGTVGAVENLSTEDFLEQMTTNFMGSVHVAKATLPILRKRGEGRIILVSSVGDRIATPGAAAYYSSKWAIAGFGESLAREVNPLGITVSIVEPGGMKTDFAEDSSLKIVPFDQAYDATVGTTARMMKAPGYADSYDDPAKVADVILKVAESDAPPLRLLIGAQAYQYGTLFDQERSTADKDWEWLTRLAD